MRLLLAALLVLLPVPVHAEYLGNLSANEFDQNSIANPYGAGSPFSPNSITNKFGVYGSPFSIRSANNPYATEAPRLYDQQGNYRGELSTNRYDPDSVSNPYGRYGSPYSPDSLNNQFGAGNPYRLDSPTNPYGRGWHIEGRAGPSAPGFLSSPSHASVSLPFDPWDDDMDDMDDLDASLQRDEMLMDMRMWELMRIQAERDRVAKARAAREAQKLRELAQQQRRQRQWQESPVMAKRALGDLGLTQRRHLYLMIGELAERKRTDPEAFARWLTTTTLEQRYKELAQDVLTIVCAVGPSVGCPSGH